jgi:hypothetical protein
MVALVAQAAQVLTAVAAVKPHPVALAATVDCSAAMVALADQALTLGHLAVMEAPAVRGVRAAHWPEVVEPVETMGALGVTGALVALLQELGRYCLRGKAEVKTLVVVVALVVVLFGAAVLMVVLAPLAPIMAVVDLAAAQDHKALSSLNIKE